MKNYLDYAMCRNSVDVVFIIILLRGNPLARGEMKRPAIENNKIRKKKKKYKWFFQIPTIEADACLFYIIFIDWRSL